MSFDGILHRSGLRLDFFAHVTPVIFAEERGWKPWFCEELLPVQQVCKLSWDISRSDGLAKLWDQGERAQAKRIPCWESVTALRQRTVPLLILLANSPEENRQLLKPNQRSGCNIRDFQYWINERIKVSERFLFLFLIRHQYPLLLRTLNPGLKMSWLQVWRFMIAGHYS